MMKNNNRQPPDFLIKTAWHSIQRMYSALAKKEGVSQAMGFVLISISKEGSNATQISKNVGVKSISLTRTLQDLNKKGFISKAVDSNDKRKVIYTLTHKGIEARKIISKVISDFNELLLNRISEKDLLILERVICTIERSTEDFLNHETKNNS